MAIIHTRIGEITGQRNWHKVDHKEIASPNANWIGSRITGTTVSGSQSAIHLWSVHSTLSLAYTHVFKSVRERPSARHVCNEFIDARARGDPARIQRHTTHFRIVLILDTFIYFVLNVCHAVSPHKNDVFIFRPRYSPLIVIAQFYLPAILCETFFIRVDTSKIFDGSDADMAEPRRPNGKNIC